MPAVAGGFNADDFVLLRTAGAVESPLWPLDRNDLGEDGGAGHFYRPLWVAWNAGLQDVFGDERPAAFHTANLVLFALLAAEVFLLAAALLPRAGAVAAGLAFALYPRHGESVAWVSGSTDLLAGVLGLGALLALARGSPRGARLAAAVALAVLAALAKEAAFLLPALALLVLAARGLRGRALWHPAIAIAVAFAAVFVIRTIVLGGLGGYGDEGLGPKRIAGTAASYAAAAFSPAQTLLLRDPVLLVIPAALAGLLGAALWRLRDADAARRRVALAGLAWFALALVPVLGLPLDLNNANGERLLLIPSVGLALALGAAVPPRPPRAAVAALAAGGLAAAALCADVARSWDTAGDLADRTARQAAALAPPGGRLVVLSIPDSYRSARVFTNSFDLALARAGSAAAKVDWCAPALVLERRSGAIRFEQLPDAAYLGRTTADAAFDFPVLRDPAPLTPGCGYTRRKSDEGSPGLRRSARAEPAPGGPSPVVIAWFDGRDVRRLR